jgi:hypothetical protein
LSANWNRSVKLEALAEPALESLEVGSSDLADCLSALGAPTRVWEVDGGAALAWHWVDRSDWGVTLSVPTGDAVSANLSYGTFDTDARGAVLFFDEAWGLTALRRGQIAELLSGDRRRPAFVD